MTCRTSGSSPSVTACSDPRCPSSSSARSTTSGTTSGSWGSVSVAGPFVIYHTFGPNLVDAEVCVPVAGDILCVGRLATRLLPGVTVARTVHVGPYEELGAAYAALIRWIGPRGFEAAGPVRERYVEGPGREALPADYRTVIDLPVARAAVAAH